MMTPEFITPWFLNGNLTVLAIQTCYVYETIMLFSKNQRILCSTLIITMIQVFARFHYIVISGVSKP